MYFNPMLIQYTPLAQLDEGAKQRLARAMMAGLAHCDEARNHGYVVFEGHALRMVEVNTLLVKPTSTQMLLG